MNRNALSPLTPARLCGLLLILALAAGCQRVAPIRTLPSWVRGVYIPMMKNESFEPGLEEVATRKTQEAFLADGRVDIVPKEQADLILVATLKDWMGETIRTKGEHIASTQQISLMVALQLYDPFDLKTPMADLGTFVVNTNFNSDTRSNRYEPEPDRKERLMETLADQIVLHVINGFPANLPDLPPGTNVPQFRTPETIVPYDTLKPRQEQDAPLTQ